MPSSITVTNLKSILAAAGYLEIRNLTSTAVAVLVAKTKVEKVIPHLMVVLREYQPKQVSTRELQIGTVKVHAKDKSLQRGIKALSFGRGNEHNFMTTINEWMRDYGKPIKIVFHGEGGKTFIANNIVKTQHTGATGIFDRMKADVHLIDKEGKHVPLSLKDDNAEKWESIDTYWGARSKKFLQWSLEQGQTSLTENGVGGFQIKPLIAVPATTRETVDVAFGRDILGKGAILVRRFRPDSFKWDFATDTLNIECTSIMTTLADVRGKHEAFMQIQNEKGRNPQHLYKGLRAVAVMRLRITGDTKVFPQRAQIGI